MTITIAGAGVAGLCCAYELAGRGHGVTVYEKAPSPEGNTCSRFAGGMLAPWCEGETADDVVTRLGQNAIDWWDLITPVTRRGTLVVAPSRDQAELSRFARRTTGHKTVDTTALEPQLALGKGLFFAKEGHLDPQVAMKDLAMSCEQRGVRIIRGQFAPANTNVDCTGIAAPLADLRAVRGEMVLLHCPELALCRTIRLLHPRFPAYLVPRGDGVYMLGATMIESNATGPVTLRSMMELLGAAFALHPGFAEAKIIMSATGLRPAFRDNLPRVERVDGRWHVNGLYRHGFLLAPAMATELADKLEDAQ